MPTQASGDGKRRTAVRRKVSLACDSCREKKIRCDGIKPICGPCGRRSYRIDQCVYSTHNPRTASRDEYFHTLHQRIRELEDACLKAGVPIQTNASPANEQQPRQSSRQEIPTAGEIEFAAERMESTVCSTGLGFGEIPIHGRLERLRGDENSEERSASERNCTKPHESPLFNDNEGHITAMGQISAPDGEPRSRSSRVQFYGGSSTASLMRLVRESMPLRLADGSHAESVFNTKLQDTITDYRLDEFVMPPRALADHLVSCFFEKVYVLYPFFHRPSFDAAYSNIWRAEDEPKAPITDLRIGLGSSADSGSKSIVFHSALNMIFALGCHFADIAPEEREPVAHSFFLRAKRFVGLDLLDINTLGVVQTLLIAALYLQSSPYPSRCWNAVGVACRVALGQGLHGSDNFDSLKPLESDIRRRTWHGCVMLDITLSMTYGRPSMTTHLAPVPPPSDSGVSCDQDDYGGPSLMAFYIEAIKLYDILDRILGDVYKAWRSRSRQDQQLSQSSWTTSLGGLDTVLDIERQLAWFETNVPSFLKWSAASPATYMETQPNLAIAQQRNVLHARFIHLHLLLYRPMFTQFYSETGRQRESGSASRGGDGNDCQANSTSGKLPTQSILYSSMSSKCATACVMSAIDLTHLVHETYQTNIADAWWYNGFYVSTAAIVLLMSFSAPSILDSIAIDKARDAWREATTILAYMATFSRAASNTLQFLEAAYRQTVAAEPSQPHPHSHQPGSEFASDASSLLPHDILQSYDPYDNQDNSDPAQAPFFNWEEVAENLGPNLDDLGFLTRVDFPNSFGRD